MESGKTSSDGRDRARGFRTEGKFHRALTLFEKERDQFPHDESLLREIAGILFHLDRIDEAIEMYEAFLRTWEENGPAWNDLGALRFEQRQHPAARLSFREAIRLQGRNSDLLCNLANACIETGLKREGIRLLREVIEKNQLDLRAHCLLGIEIESTRPEEMKDPVNIGQRVEVSRSTLFSGLNENQEWISRVEDFGQNLTRISFPSSGWRNLQLRRGTRIILGYTGEDALWGAMGEVTNIVTDNIPLFEIRTPSAFQRIQRRSHFRVARGKTLQRIIVPEEGDIRFQEENLSASGVGVFVRNPLTPGSELTLQMDLRGEKIQIGGRVVREVPCGKKGYRVGITFTELDDIKLERLARYVHSLQLEWQKRRIP